MNKEINQELVDYAYTHLKNVPKGPEYEKMISSVAYNCFDDELVRARVTSHEDALDYEKIRLRDYDNDLKKHAQARFDYLEKIFGHVEKDVYMEPPFFVDYGCNVSFGKGYYANFNITYLDCTLIRFGDNVLVGPNATFTTATHPTDPESRLNGVEYARPITVGNNVWFGANIVVLPDVTIGDNCVIGAGAVVTKSVPANSVVVGCPGRVVKTLTSKDDKKAVALEVGA